MSDYRDKIDALGDGAESLRQSAESTAVVFSTFETHLRLMRETLAATNKDVATLEKGLSRGLRRALDGLVLDGSSLSQVMETLSETISRTAYNAALKPITDHVSGLFANGVNGLLQTVLPFADGAPFSQGRVMPFASGGVVSGATPFGMRGGMGIMGEAGPEAIMPLARGADGRLGVQASGGGGGPTIVMNISTPDVQGFARSKSQIAAQMSRALARSNRNR